MLELPAMLLVDFSHVSTTSLFHHFVDNVFMIWKYRKDICDVNETMNSPFRTLFLRRSKLWLFETL